MIGLFTGLFLYEAIYIEVSEEEDPVLNDDWLDDIMWMLLLEEEEASPQEW